MKNLIPTFITDQLEHNRQHGAIEAAGMFVDISGFTQMTETLMRGGSEGAEILSAIISDIFSRIEDVIYPHHGFISTFAGDAFTTIFQVSDRHDATAIARHSIQCAVDIQDIFRVNRIQKTAFGDFEFSAKVGLAYGPTQWGIIGEEQKAYYFRGAAIDHCAEAEVQANRSEIVIHESLIGHLQGTRLNLTPVNAEFQKLDSLSETIPPDEVVIVDIPRPISALFVPDTILSFSQVGEFRNVVSVFISFRGVDDYDSLTAFISRVVDGINQFGGYFNKIDFGDKGGVILCAFGAPVAYENNIDRSLEFILSLRQSCDAATELRDLEFRTGITYGTVFAGFAGGHRRAEYTIYGDIVNLSARIMMGSDLGKTWVSESIYQYAGNSFSFEFLGHFEFKGKSVRIPIYQLNTKMIDVEEKFDGQYIGRSAEFERSATAMSPLRETRFAGILYIYGDAGMGKSRFVYELKQQFVDYNWLFFPCDGILKKPFNPFYYFFNRFFKLAPDHNPAENKQSFEAIYQVLIDKTRQTDIRTELIRLKTVIAGFLGITYPDSLYDQLEPQLRYENILYGFREIFKSLSLQRPLVIEVDDFHWIDPDSKNVLQTLANNIESFPIMIVATSRYDNRDNKPKFSVNAPETEIDLNTLTREEIRNLVESRLAGSIDSKLLDIFAKQTQGNPLFLEQTVLYFQETQQIRLGKDHVWTLAGDQAKVPGTVTDLLVARVDRLADDLKQTIQSAAVIGRDFDPFLLSSILRHLNDNFDFNVLDSQLVAGEAENIWVRQTQVRFLFSSALMHDAIYQMQLKKRRRELHQLVAEKLAQLSPGDESIYTDLAFHYDRAENLTRSVEYLFKAATVAKKNYENEIAIGFYNRFIALVDKTGPDDRPVLDEWLQKTFHKSLDRLYVEGVYENGCIAQMIGQIDQARELFTHALEMANDLQEPDLIGDIQAQIGDILFYHGDFDAAMAYWSRNIQNYQKINLTSGLANTYYNIGMIFLTKGELNEAAEYYEKALEYSRSARNQLLISRALGGLGVLFFRTGDFSRALEYYREGLEINEQLNNKKGIIIDSINIGPLYQVCNQFDKAKSCYETALAFAQEMGYKQAISIATGNLGDLYLDWGDYDQAISNFEQKLKISRELSDNVEIAVAQGNLGIAYHQKRLCHKALQYHEQAISALRQLRVKYYLPFFLIDAAEIFLTLGKMAVATDYLDEAAPITEEMGQTGNLFQIRVLQARLKAFQGHIEEAAAELQEMMAATTQPEDLAMLNFELWRFTEGEECRQRACELYKQLHNETQKTKYEIFLNKLEQD